MAPESSLFQIHGRPVGLTARRPRLPGIGNVQRCCRCRFRSKRWRTIARRGLVACAIDCRAHGPAVSGDLENGFGEAPDVIAENVRRAASAGLGGLHDRGFYRQPGTASLRSFTCRRADRSRRGGSPCAPVSFRPDGSSPQSPPPMHRTWRTPSAVFRLSKKSAPMCSSLRAT